MRRLLPVEVFDATGNGDRKGVSESLPDGGVTSRFNSRIALLTTDPIDRLFFADTLRTSLADESSVGWQMDILRLHRLWRPTEDPAERAMDLIGPQLDTSFDLQECSIVYLPTTALWWQMWKLGMKAVLVKPSALPAAIPLSPMLHPVQLPALIDLKLLRRAASTTMANTGFLVTTRPKRTRPKSPRTRYQ